MSEPALDLSEIMDLYKEDARTAVRKMRAALDRWDDVQQGGAARQELRKISHQLRGSGRTYGYRNVSRYGKAMESIILRLDKAKLPADDRMRKSIQNKVELLARIFSA